MWCSDVLSSALWKMNWKNAVQIFGKNSTLSGEFECGEIYLLFITKKSLISILQHSILTLWWWLLLLRRILETENKIKITKITKNQKSHISPYSWLTLTILYYSQNNVCLALSLLKHCRMWNPWRSESNNFKVSKNLNYSTPSHFLSSEQLLPTVNILSFLLAYSCFCKVKIKKFYFLMKKSIHFKIRSN